MCANQYEQTPDPVRRWELINDISRITNVTNPSGGPCYQYLMDGKIELVMVKYVIILYYLDMAVMVE